MLISVVAPVYNTKQYLAACVDSVLAQTFTDFELVLVDDGSTDGSGALCDELARGDQRVRVVHQQNCGLSGAEKAGVLAARGDYIAFVDSDDSYAPEMLAALAEGAQRTGADIVQCGITLVCGNKTKQCVALQEQILTQTKLQAVLQNALFGDGETLPLDNPRWNKLYRTSLLRQVIESRPDAIKTGEDLFLNMAVLPHCQSALILAGQANYLYRQQAQSMLHKPDATYVQQALAFVEAQQTVFAGYEQLSQMQDVRLLYFALLCACGTWPLRAKNNIVHILVKRLRTRESLRAFARTKGAASIFIRTWGTSLQVPFMALLHVALRIKNNVLYAK